ncbi:MAG: protein kinase [Rubripirellula sp.]
MPAAESYDFLTEPSQPSDLGTLGHYRVIDELGKGGMGFVFRAEDIKLKRSVALKVMNQKIAATPNSRRRFIHEARAMAAVHHDNVATIFEVGESNNTPFMAMEMLKGSTLESFNKSKTQVGFEQVIDYARQISHGLAAAHAQGIVHRDIKPANIWLEEGNNRIKILDFGLALASTPVDHLAGRGAVIGTPGYLSPEQARSEPLDDRSDLYSLGVVLYELCTCKLPILSKSVPGQLISILAHRPTPINDLNPEIPQPLCDLIHRLLRKEPRTRPKSAAFLVEELDRVEEECHAKSEVAQAINKLQAGLSEVVSKGAEDAFFDTVEEIHEPMPDPLAAIPAPVTMTPPARPVSANRKAPAKPESNLPAYWPLAAVGAFVLVALPVLTYMFGGAGRSDVAYVIPQDPNANVNAQVNSNGQNANGQNKSQSQNQNKQRNNHWQNRQGKKNGQNNQGNKNWQNKNEPSGNNQQPENGGAPVLNDVAESDDPPMVDQVSDADPTEMASVNKPPIEAPAMSDPVVPESFPNSEPPELELQWTTVSVADGRGADAHVQRGVSSKHGTKPSVAIGSRKGKETHHIYLRFDLAEVEDVRRHVAAAELILTFLNVSDLDCMVRVYGIADVGPWPENELEWKNSYSRESLDKFPLLVEQVFGNSDIEEIDERKAIRLSSPELAQFVKNSSSDTLTFVLTGDTKTDDTLRFVSRENSKADRPVKLRLEVPVNPPVDEKNKNRNNKRR